MFQGTHGHFDFVEYQWHRAWEQPSQELHHIRDIFTTIRDQTVYRKLAGDTSLISVAGLIHSSGLNVGRWMDRYDAALQVLTNNVWIAYSLHATMRGRQYVSEEHLRNRHRTINPNEAILALSGRCLSVSKLPSVDHVMQHVGDGLLGTQR